MLTIFVWRIFAKSFCLSILPPIFRFLSHLVTLPHRRFYTPATDYTSVPPEKGLRPIPSVIDLPRMVEIDGVVAGAGASTARPAGGYGAVKQRSGRGARADGGVGEKAAVGAGATKEGARDGWAEQPSEKRERGLKHYDADGAHLSLLS